MQQMHGRRRKDKIMIQKLIQKIQKTHAPIVVGLDPMLSYVPAHIQKRAFEEHGETLEGAAEAIWQYNKEIVDHVYDLIPAVKPQIAMYEQFGIPGLMAFKKTVDYCKSKDCCDRRYQTRRYRIDIRSLCSRTSWKSQSRKQQLCRI